MRVGDAWKRLEQFSNNVGCTWTLASAGKACDLYRQLSSVTDFLHRIFPDGRSVLDGLETVFGTVGTKVEALDRFVRATTVKATTHANSVIH